MSEGDTEPQKGFALSAASMAECVKGAIDTVLWRFSFFPPLHVSFASFHSIH